MNNKSKIIPEFTSYMSKGEYIKALVWLPIHMAVLPAVAGMLMAWGYIDESMGNFGIYAVGMAYMLVFLGKYLRREYDPFCDRPMYCISEICGCYLTMWVINIALNSLMYLLLKEVNPNNMAILDMAGMNFGMVSAMAICLAPVVEEIIFRGAIFTLGRKKSRIMGYALSMVLFSVYHIWGYAIENPVYLLFLLQYLPVSFLLCRCYERTNSLWSCIFFHMVVNAMSMYSMEAMM